MQNIFVYKTYLQIEHIYMACINRVYYNTKDKWMRVRNDSFPSERRGPGSSFYCHLFYSFVKMTDQKENGMFKLKWLLIQDTMTFECRLA